MFHSHWISVLLILKIFKFFYSIAQTNIKKNNFLEYAEVYKDIYYGTPKDKVLEKLNNGINDILEIDVDGKEIVKKNYNDCISIFIKPKSLSELENRLLKRKQN